MRLSVKELRQRKFQKKETKLFGHFLNSRNSKRRKEERKKRIHNSNKIKNLASKLTCVLNLNGKSVDIFRKLTAEDLEYILNQLNKLE